MSFMLSQVREVRCPTPRVTLRLLTAPPCPAPPCPALGSHTSPGSATSNMATETKSPPSLYTRTRFAITRKTSSELAKKATLEESTAP
ncbi:hypothetical protein FKM82_029332 [Ascaphus truei]